MSQAIEDKHDHVGQLVALGKERGYLLFDEVNDILPPEVHSPEEIDNLLSTLETYRIGIYEDVSAAKAALEAVEPLEPEVKEEGALSDEVELDLTPGLLEKTTDPVRIYLREMGTVPLLTREGEVVLAKRIERGRFLVLKTITRSPIVIKELLAIAKDLREGARSIKEIVHFDDEVKEETVEKKTRQTLKILSLQRRTQTGRETRVYPEIEAAFLFACLVRNLPGAHPDVAIGAFDRIEYAGAQALDRQAPAEGGASALAGARSGQARAPHGCVQG